MASRPMNSELDRFAARALSALLTDHGYAPDFEELVDILIEVYQEDILQARRPPAVPPVVAMIAITQIAVGSSFQMSPRLAS